VIEPQAPNGTDGQEHSSRRALLVIGAIVVAGLLVTVVYALQASSFQSFASIAAFGMATAGASLLVGGLIGLLFGIPRTLQQQEPEPGKRSEDEETRGSALYSPNTNLEQISDWLTKILVGVGLTQIGQINNVLGEIGDVAARGMGDFTGSKPFSIAMIIYFTLGGFLLGYLWTRLYLGRALTAADTYSLKKKLDRFEQDARALRAVADQLSGEAKRPTQVELEAAIKAASPEARSHIFYRAQYQRWRNWQNDFTKPIMERTIPVFRALVASDVENEYHANYGELGYALKDQRQPDWEGAEQALSRAISIRGEKAGAKEPAYYYYEINRAICRIMRDQAFHHEKPTAKEAQSAIAADIKAGIQDYWVRSWAKDYPAIAKWLKINKLDLGDPRLSPSTGEDPATAS